MGTGISMVITNFTNLAANVIYTNMQEHIKDAVIFPDRRAM